MTDIPKLNPEAESIIAHICVAAISRQPWLVLLNDKIVAVGSTQEEAQQKADALAKVSPAHYVVTIREAKA